MGLLKKKSIEDDSCYLIAGLGNPGKEYEGTRHNAGFMTLDLYAGKHGAKYWKDECGAICAHVQVGCNSLILVKPQSFMNLSGGPISKLMDKYKVSADRLIVIHDELDIEPGTIRLKYGGGLAGHNGLKSISNKIQTNDFYRIRVGIGRPPGRMPVSDYVLTTPKGDMLALFEEGIEKAADACQVLLDDGLVVAQDRFN